MSSEVSKKVMSKKGVFTGIAFIVAGIILLAIWLIFFTVNVRTTELLYVPTASIPTNWDVLSQPFRINIMGTTELLATGIGWSLALIHILFIGVWELFHKAIGSNKVILGIVSFLVIILILIDGSANYSFAAPSGTGAQIMFMILVEIVICLFWKMGLYSIEKGFELI